MTGLVAPVFRLAQFNFARANFPPDDARMKAFVDALDEINRLAETSPGFIWRFQTDRGHSIDVRPFADDELKLITLSMWRDVESLRQFVYRGAHAAYLRRRHEWFEPPTETYLVIWWHRDDLPPTVEEGIERLEMLKRLGPSPCAFDFSRTFPPEAANKAEMHDERISL